MYNELIVENFSSPSHSGALEAPDLTFKLGNPVCGDRIEIDAHIADAKISEAKYRAWGCATSIATANIFCKYIEKKQLLDLVKTPKQDIEQLLGELDPSQVHCLEMLHELFAQMTQARELV